MVPAGSYYVSRLFDLVFFVLVVILFSTQISKATEPTDGLKDATRFGLFSLGFIRSPYESTSGSIALELFSYEYVFSNRLSIKIVPLNVYAWDPHRKQFDYKTGSVDEREVVNYVPLWVRYYFNRKWLCPFIGIGVEVHRYTFDVPDYFYIDHYTGTRTIQRSSNSLAGEIGILLNSYAHTQPGLSLKIFSSSGAPGDRTLYTLSYELAFASKN